MKKTLKIFLGTLAVTCFCCGCGKSHQEESSSSSEFPLEIHSEKSDKIKVQAQCVYPDVCKNGKGKKATLGEELFWDRKEEIKQLFFEDEEIEDEYINDYDNVQESVYFGDNQETSLIIDTNNYLYYSTANASDVQNVIITGEQYSDYNGDLYLKDKDLAFMTRKEAWTEVESFLEKLGVSVSEEFTCYVMEHSVMQEEEERLILESEEMGGKIEKKKTAWTQADDCYYFVCRTSWEGYPILPAISGEGIDENNVNIIYGQDGIQGVQISGYYPLREGEHVAIQNPEKVVEKVREVLENVISEDSYEIQKITLCQKVTGYQYKNHKANVIPVWECQIIVKSGRPDDNGYMQKLYFNGETLDGVE